MSPRLDLAAFTGHTAGDWSLTHRRIIERPVMVREHFAIAPAAGPTFAFFPSSHRADIQRANAELATAAPALLAYARDLEIALQNIVAAYSPTVAACTEVGIAASYPQLLIDRDRARALLGDGAA